MGYECIVCMETLENPAPAAAVAVPPNLQEPERPGPSRKQIVQRAAEDTPEYRSKICSTACGHIFHRSCLNRWFHQRMRKECPSCRKVLTPGKIFHIYPPCLSDDFITFKRYELEDIEKELPQCTCGTEDCKQLFVIHRTLASDHGKLLELLRRFTNQADDKALLLAKIASLEDECDRLKQESREKTREPGPAEISSDDTERFRLGPNTYGGEFRIPLPTASRTGSSSTTDSEADNNIFSSIITALMSPSQLARIMNENGGTPLNLNRLRPQTSVTTSSTTTTAPSNATTQNLGTVVFSSREFPSSQASDEIEAAVTNALRLAMPGSANTRSRSNGNSNSAIVSFRTVSSNNQVPSNPVRNTPVPSATATRETNSQLQPRIDINLINPSTLSSSIRNNTAERTSENIPNSNSARQNHANKVKHIALKSTTRPMRMRQLALKSTSLPPRDSYPLITRQSANRPSTSSNHYHGTRNNTNNTPTSNDSASSNPMKLKLIATKSTSKATGSTDNKTWHIPTTSTNVTPSSSTVTKPQREFARKSTSKPPPPIRESSWSSSYYYNSYSSESDSDQELELKRRKGI